LLLLHAFPLQRRMFDPQKDALAAVARLMTLDAPGAGDSELSDVSMERIADCAALLLDQQKIERAVIGGVSMGGYAAFAFVRRHPERLRGLILANTRAAADNDEAKKARRLLAEVARTQGASEVANRMLPRLLGDTTRAQRHEIVEYVREMIEATDPEAIAALSLALGERADSHDLLESIQVPTLVIAGEEDPIAPPQEAAGWAARIPDAKFVAISEAGHLPNVETPERFNEEVIQFLRTV
jgi:pimeloyl-ACP methyl ester carboxylesterase